MPDQRETDGCARPRGQPSLPLSMRRFGGTGERGNGRQAVLPGSWVFPKTPPMRHRLTQRSTAPLSHPASAPATRDPRQGSINPRPPCAGDAERRSERPQRDVWFIKTYRPAYMSLFVQRYLCTPTPLRRCARRNLAAPPATPAPPSLRHPRFLIATKAAVFGNEDSASGGRFRLGSAISTAPE